MKQEKQDINLARDNISMLHSSPVTKNQKTEKETPKKSVKSQDVRSFGEKEEITLKKQWLPTLRESNNYSPLRKGQLKKFLRLAREKIVD